MNTQPAIGTGGCLTGLATRFDGERKRTGFMMDELAQRVAFKPVCPGMVIGLSTPRPVLRLVQTPVEEIHMRFNHAPHKNVTEKIADFISAHLAILGELLGFIVCAKLPGYGMEYAWLHDEKDNRGREGDARLFTDVPMAHYPWLPVEKDSRLHDPLLQENFVERVFALYELNALRARSLARRGLLAFHSHYRLRLLAHHQAGYREIGLLVASLHKQEGLGAFSEVYHEKLMAVLKQSTSQENHTNVLTHVWGHFRDQLNSRQRGELREVILNYRAGLPPVLVPLTLLKHYLVEYLDRYLQAQNYFDPYPQDLVLRLTVN